MVCFRYLIPFLLVLLAIACGGAAESPSPTLGATPTESQTPEATPAATPTLIGVPAPTSDVTATPTETSTGTGTQTPRPISTEFPFAMPFTRAPFTTPILTPTPTSGPTSEPPGTPTPFATPTAGATPSSVIIQPPILTPTPTFSPTPSPTTAPPPATPPATPSSTPSPTPDTTFEMPAVPTFPNIFSGQVFLGSDPAAPRSQVLACVDGCASGWESFPISVGEDGAYQTLIVQPPSRESYGKDITFFILTDDGRVQADEMSAFSGDVANLSRTIDLHFPTPSP